MSGIRSVFETTADEHTYHGGSRLPPRYHNCFARMSPASANLTIRGRNANWTTNYPLDFLRNAAYAPVGMLLTPKKLQRRTAKLRDPEGTRQRLLQAAFREVYRYGFQSAGIDAILAATNVTKGALYYHFESKEALGHAIIEEIIAEITKDRWLRPLQQSKDKNPIDALIGIVQAIPARPRDVKRGCPLVNLTQEMSQLDEQFRKRLERIFQAWQEGIATALRKGQSTGTVRRDLVPEETASFLIAMVEGYEVLAKNAQDAKVWNMGIKNIVSWLSSLRAVGNGKRG
jgi:TetR/AcrR family transcriptional repressor of nem operon